ncbi:uncharacterized protein LOC121972824 [Zingiber officinale]|uniref:uncharacterized protein LOC121972824 n=1 Tax=Zingiber officinale TaxID=94328 RepID=UPI001C4AEBED|nr:uncharacterized protein LOC121972824 [Zingiber officinale]
MEATRRGGRNRRRGQSPWFGKGAAVPSGASKEEGTWAEERDIFEGPRESQTRSAISNVDRISVTWDAHAWQGRSPDYDQSTAFPLFVVATSPPSPASNRWPLCCFSTSGQHIDSERNEAVGPLLERVRAFKIAPPLLNSLPSMESGLSDILVRKLSSSSSAL